MVDAYIFDAVRSPRGKGKKSGSLHEITALSLLTQQLEAIKIKTINIFLLNKLIIKICLRKVLSLKKYALNYAHEKNRLIILL